MATRHRLQVLCRKRFPCTSALPYALTPAEGRSTQPTSPAPVCLLQAALSARDRAWAALSVPPGLGVECARYKWRQSLAYVEVFSLVPDGIAAKQVRSLCCSKGGHPAHVDVTYATGVPEVTLRLSIGALSSCTL